MAHTQAITKDTGTSSEVPLTTTCIIKQLSLRDSFTEKKLKIKQGKKPNI